MAATATASSTRHTTADVLFTRLDGSRIQVRGGCATLRVFAVHRTAAQWWVQYELHGDVASSGVLAIGARERAETVLERISKQAG